MATLFDRQGPGKTPPGQGTPEGGQQAGETTEKPKKQGPDWLERVLHLKPGWIRRLVLVVLVVVVFFVLGTVISRLWTDYLWFQELGHTNVWSTPIVAKLLVSIFFGLLFFGFLYGNLALARKLAPRFRPVTEAADNNIIELITKQRWTGRLMLFASIVVAIIVAISYRSSWDEVMLFLNRQEFGYSDPLFGKDASFFVYTLPLWSVLVNFVGVTVLLTAIATIFTYVAERALVLTKRNRIAFAPHVKAHISGILALAMVAKAGDYMLQTWELDYSTRGVTFGASYTDVHAALPVLHFLAIVSLIAAALFLLNIRFKGWRLPIIAIGVMFLTWIFAGKVYPAIIQQYRVSPNEITMESEYIASNIEATRWAYGLDDFAEVPIEATTDLTAADIVANAATTDNIRLWEPRPALDTYSQIQEIRLYYAFNDVDVDRYVIDGRFRQVLISARELDQSQLQAQSQTWVNQHLVYTHGYGFVLSPVNEAGGKGLPVLLVSNIPPVTSTDLKITQPAIYYGELGNDFVLVKTNTDEFDYPQGDENKWNTYAGEGGVSIGSGARKLAFAFRFGSMKLLFSDALTPDSHIMFRRTLTERLHALAPFLAFDNDPYLVLRDDGTLVWMWDAYATTDRFPYSQPRANRTNYIRNAVKVVVDAYNGGVTLYQMDPDDAITNTWGRVYDGLFTPGDQMPADLRAHRRYPEDLYSMQAEVLATYHMDDPQIFYNKEDAWEIPMEIYGNSEIPVVPYYEVLALPGETEPESALLLPFAPLSKKNMTALLVARQDGEHYGELMVVTFPKNKLVFGPAQVEAQISNDPVISSQLTLWNQSGSQVIRGNLLVVPINESVMYFEPVYLQSEQSPIPDLTRVIVAYDDEVVMEPTLQEALIKIFGEGVSGTTTTISGPTTTEGPTTTTLPGTTTTTASPTTTVPGVTTTTTPGGVLPTDTAELIALANQYYEAALQAQKDGDWAEYGRLIDELGRVLEALAATR
jgi:uncharacterized membrane protein (UPF0182 family)